MYCYLQLDHKILENNHSLKSEWMIILHFFLNYPLNWYSSLLYIASDGTKPRFKEDSEAKYRDFSLFSSRFYTNKFSEI